MRPAQMSAAELAEAAGFASETIRLHLAAADAEREWLECLLREIAERAGVAPKRPGDG